MDRAEHATLLRRAMAQAEVTNGDLATALGVSTRTVVNWISRSDPTMPSEVLQEKLRRLLPGYVDAGDPVEVALNRAELSAWRRSTLIAEYQRHLHEHQLEEQRLSRG